MSNPFGPEQSEIIVPNSIRLALLAAIGALVVDVLSILSLLESIEEYNYDTKKETFLQTDIQEKVIYLQKQIDELSRQIDRLK